MGTWPAEPAAYRSPWLLAASSWHQLWRFGAPAPAPSPQSPVATPKTRDPGPETRYHFPVSQHLHKAAGPTSVRVALLTISDTRTEATDTSGAAIGTLLEQHGHQVIARAIVKDEPGAVTSFVAAQLRGEAQVIITTGGTGITSRDSTFEAIDEMLEKRLDGFGELFRMLSYSDIGSAAMMSRACAGLARGRVIVALPGSESAVRLAMTSLVLPELGHLVQQAST